jgi:hypothetical protein
MLMTHTITGTSGSIDVVGVSTTVTTSAAIGGAGFFKTGLGTLVMNGIRGCHALSQVTPIEETPTALNNSAQALAALGLPWVTGPQNPLRCKR